MIAALPEQSVIVPIDQVKPSPENDFLYHPISRADDAFKALVRSFRENGQLEPIIVDCDGWIVSGHRRHAAAKAAGFTTVKISRLDDLSREIDPEGFVRRLAEHNKQRIKTFDERWNEEVLNVTTESAYSHLIEYRREKSDMADFSAQPHIKLGGKVNRKKISPAKSLMLAAAQKVIEESRASWPMSDRKIHYRMLNIAPLRHAKKKDSTYANDKESYKDLCDLLTRARLAGDIPWDAISDDTRPFTQWNVYSEPGQFIREQTSDFLRGYNRNLLQSQSAYIEILAEKLTVKSVVKGVASDYCLPFCIGRGYASLAPRYDLLRRYRKSGKEKLIIIFVSDFDPEGESIAESFARSMRDDFGINAREITAIKASLTPEQVKRFKLPPAMEAKEKSSRFKKFKKKHGTKVWELEALTDEQLADELRNVVKSVLDLEAFEAEQEQEAEDARQLEARRRALLAPLTGGGIQ